MVKEVIDGIFISHSAIDGKIITQFVELLESGMGVRDSKVFCSSIPGTITLGKTWTEDILQNLAKKAVFIPVLSNTYIASAMCLIELGAAWIEKKKIVPVMVPPFVDPPQILREIQHCKINLKDDLNQLKASISILVESSKPVSEAHWRRLRDKFVRDIGPLCESYECWIYAYKAKRNGDIRNIIGWFEVTHAPFGIAEIKNAECYWLWDYPAELEKRGNWHSVGAFLDEDDRMQFFYRMQPETTNETWPPNAPHDGTIRFFNTKRDGQFGDRYYKGCVHDLDELSDCSGTILAERLIPNVRESSLQQACRLVRYEGRQVFEKLMKVEGIPLSGGLLE